MTSETIARSYFTVMTNDIPAFRHLNLDRFIDVIAYVFTQGNIEYGKYNISVNEVSGKVHEFIQQSVSGIESHEMIDGNEYYYLFKCHGIYFYITWQIVDDMYEFAIMHGVNYSSDVNGVFVFGDESDASTVVSDDFYTTDFTDDSDDSDFDINDMSDL